MTADSKLTALSKYEIFKRTLHKDGIFFVLIAGARYARGFLFDKRHGTRTSMRVALADDLTIAGDRETGHDLVPMPVGPFCATFRKLRIPADGTFVDFGAGNARTLLLAAEFGFGKVIGVEFAKEFCELGKGNIEAYRKRRGGSVEAHMVCIDAARYKIQPDNRVFFFFNPFDADILKQVVANIEHSVAAHPRTAWIIYSKPRHEEVLDSLSSPWEKSNELSYRGFGRVLAYRFMP
ncbi:class I SAM-dependent methyltransferase [Frankia sp. CiP3]|uniref:class I SAM-dependent methyltransferase n=1 Tax=Frankia sp. CiP3 TaxID=2880971 RepID=UPI001EF6E1E4|nr:class I SAM-dependent methyltransferase [Frankia sp. CiP3]